MAADPAWELRARELELQTEAMLRRTLVALVVSGIAIIIAVAALVLSV
jgi:hypothetical protein